MEPISKGIEIKNSKINIESLTLDRLQALIFAPDFTTDNQYTSIYTQKETFERFLKKGGCVTLALFDHHIIVGFAVLDHPDAHDRWARMDETGIMEIKAVEVLRKFRQQGIARQLLYQVLSDPKIEQRIIYLAAYAWTWDTVYSGLNIQSYRNMLIDLYADFGFIEYLTNESNICLKSENIFMARIGKKIPQKIREDFKWLRFGICV